MLQIYFLSVISLFVSGFALSAGYLAEKFNSMKSAEEYFKEHLTTRLLLGLATIIIGVLKFITPTYGDTVIIGDALPALAGLWAGLLILLEYYKDRSDISNPGVERLDGVILKNKWVFGILIILVGFIHFLFPRLFFL